MPPCHPTFFPSVGRLLGGWPNDYLVIDIETDGFGPEALPVQLAWLAVRDRKPSFTLDGYRSIRLDWTKRGVDPERLRERIAKTTEYMESKGLNYQFTVESLMEDGIDPVEGFGIFATRLYWANSCDQFKIVGFNHFYFDLPIIKRRTDLLLPDWVWDEDKHEDFIDLGIVEKARVHNLPPYPGQSLADWFESVRRKGGKGKWNLDNARTLYELACDPSKAHDAGQDCYDTHLLLEAMRPLVEGTSNA